MKHLESYKMGKQGMVNTGSAIASDVGLQILKQGGNAVDAAIAVAAALTVVEPTANGIGSDAFAIVWFKEELIGMNASGKSPRRLTLENLKAKYPDRETMITHGITPITIPGAVAGWVALNKRFGKLSLLECLTPAINLAENGFVVSPDLAHSWNVAYEKYKKIKEEIFELDEWFETFLFDGAPPKTNQIIKLTKHAQTLKSIALSNGESFYHGKLAEKMVQRSNELGGFLELDDFKNMEVTWVTPIKITYRGYDVYELPPNGQGVLALAALNILKNHPVTSYDQSYVHAQMESMKIAFEVCKNQITDPSWMKTDIDQWLSDEFGKKYYDMINSHALDFDSLKNQSAGTVYLNTADKDGNMVSFIQSNYMGFGSGVVVEGIALNNRAHNFSINPKDVNVLAGNKRPYHTIIPGFLKKGNRAIGPFGVMGGFMQPQGHLQVLSQLLDFNQTPQAALDQPRWQYMEDKTFIVEAGFDRALIKQLQAKGHTIKVHLEPALFGRGQIIIRLEDGYYVGGIDKRTDSKCNFY